MLQKQATIGIVERWDTNMEMVESRCWGKVTGSHLGSRFQKDHNIIVFM